MAHQPGRRSSASQRDIQEGAPQVAADLVMQGGPSQLETFDPHPVQRSADKSKPSAHRYRNLKSLTRCHAPRSRCIALVWYAASSVKKAITNARLTTSKPFGDPNRPWCIPRSVPCCAINSHPTSRFQDTSRSWPANGQLAVDISDRPTMLPNVRS